MLMPHQVGQLNELVVATELTRCGCEVFMPIGSQTKADMVATYGPHIFKVQVKTATKQVIKGTIFNQCRLDNSAGAKYKEGDFAVLIVVTKDGRSLAYTWEQVEAKSSLCVGKRNPGMSITEYIQTL